MTERNQIPFELTSPGSALPESANFFVEADRRRYGGGTPPDYEKVLLRRSIRSKTPQGKTIFHEKRVPHWEKLPHEGMVFTAEEYNRALAQEDIPLPPEPLAIPSEKFYIPEDQRLVTIEFHKPVQVVFISSRAKENPEPFRIQDQTVDSLNWYVQQCVYPETVLFFHQSALPSTAQNAFVTERTNLRLQRPSGAPPAPEQNANQARPRVPTQRRPTHDSNM